MGCEFIYFGQKKEKGTKRKLESEDKSDNLFYYVTRFVGCWGQGGAISVVRYGCLGLPHMFAPPESCNLCSTCC